VLGRAQAAHHRICDDEAMRIERAVIATGMVIAAALRTHFIRRHPPRTRAETQALHEAIRRAGILLGVPGCAPAPPERSQRRAPDAGACRKSPAAF